MHAYTHMPHTLKKQLKSYSFWLAVLIWKLYNHVFKEQEPIQHTNFGKFIIKDYGNIFHSKLLKSYMVHFFFLAEVSPGSIKNLVVIQQAEFMQSTVYDICTIQAINKAPWNGPNN